MTSDSPADQAQRRLKARAFLYGLQGLLYPARNIRFTMEKEYRSFHGMLKRDMLNALFGVWEILAQASLTIFGAEVRITLDSRQGLPCEDGTFPGLEDFFRICTLSASESPDHIVQIGGREFRLEANPPVSGHLDLRLTQRSSGPVPGFRLSARTLLATWLGEQLSKWIGANSNLSLQEATEPLLIPDVGRWEISRRVSTLDLDLSGEAPPHAFRWKERTLSEAYTFADLDDHDVAAILQASGVHLPPGAHRIAKIREALPRDRACLLLRYMHRIPDPDSESELSSSDSGPPIWMNKGSIVVENDYLEILIDAGTGKVFSMDGKWRPTVAST